MEAVTHILKTVFSTDEAKVATTKTAGGAIISGLTLNEWVAVVTLIYFVLQIYFLIRRELNHRGDKSHLQGEQQQDKALEQTCEERCPRREEVQTEAAIKEGAHEVSK